VGFGRIGREMAKKARAFNMKILYHDKIQFPREVEEEYGAEYVPLHKLLTFNSIEWILGTRLEQRPAV
jgi:glyoxylate reductase